MKKLTATAIALLGAAGLFAFDWPQNEIQSDSFYSYFGQLRGETINASLIFTDSADIKAAEEGTVLAVIGEHAEGSDLFESTLGNAVIVAHKDNLMTVYANLDREQQEERYALKSVETGTNLGQCGNTGWQQGQANLEFQVIDTKNQAFINPRILMPRVGKELPLTITNVTAVSRKGQEYAMGINKRFPSGIYYLYRKRQEIAMPYRTKIFINGAATETISYDMLVQKSGKLCAVGNAFYPASIVYPDASRQLLAEVALPKGHNVITIIITDILGKETTLSYSMDAQ